MNQANNALIAQMKIDNLEFARKTLNIHGIILDSNFLRLREALNSTGSELDVDLQGEINADGLPCLRLRVGGCLQLTCQRCLEPLNYPMSIDTSFVVVAADKIPLPEDESDDVDYLEADTQMQLLDLIEDEVLLALPLAPKHALEECGAKNSIHELKKPNPFAVLASLKK